MKKSILLLTLLLAFVGCSDSSKGPESLNNVGDTPSGEVVTDTIFLEIQNNDTSDNENVIFRELSNPTSTQFNRITITNKTGGNIFLKDLKTEVDSLGFFTSGSTNCRTRLRNNRSCYINVTVNWDLGLVGQQQQLNLTTEEGNGAYVFLVATVNQQYTTDEANLGSLIVKDRDVLNFGTIRSGDTAPVRRFYLLNTSETITLDTPTVSLPSGVNLVENQCGATLKPLKSCAVIVNWPYNGEVGSNKKFFESITFTSSNMEDLDLDVTSIHAATPDAGVASLTITNASFPQTITGGQTYNRRVFVANPSATAYFFTEDQIQGIYSGQPVTVLDNTCNNGAGGGDKRLSPGERCFFDLSWTPSTDTDYIQLTINIADSSHIVEGGPAPLAEVACSDSGIASALTSDGFDLATGSPVLAGSTASNQTDISACRIESCGDSNYAVNENDSKSCVLKEIACAPAPANGTGVQTWTGTIYGTCAVTCNTGFNLDNGACVAESAIPTYDSGFQYDSGVVYQ